MLPIGRRLSDYLPEILKGHFAELCASEESELTLLWLESIYALNEVFVATATEEGLGRFESFLQITPTLADTLESRRQRILALLMAHKVITERTMIELLDGIVGKERYFYSLDYRNYHLIVTLRLSARRLRQEVAELLRARLPANLIIDVLIAYNTHDILAGFNHFDLSKYTQEELRTEQFEHTQYTRHEDLLYSEHAALSKFSHGEIMTHIF